MLGAKRGERFKSRQAIDSGKVQRCWGEGAGEEYVGWLDALSLPVEMLTPKMNEP
jgi:hypothetical protein